MLDYEFGAGETMNNFFLYVVQYELARKLGLLVRKVDESARMGI